MAAQPAAPPETPGEVLGTGGPSSSAPAATPTVSTLAINWSPPKLDNTPAEERHPWTPDERRCLYLLINEYDFSDDEAAGILQHRFPTLPRFTWRPLAPHQWMGERATHHWRVLDRPNEYNTTPFSLRELAAFETERQAIERAAATLRAGNPNTYRIIRQTGVSLYGVQIDRLHPPTSTAPMIHTPPVPALFPPPTPPAANENITSNDRPEQFVGQSQANRAPSTLQTDQPHIRLEMVHRGDLGAMKRLNGFMARSADPNKAFDDSSKRAVNKEAYGRGGEVKRFYFNKTPTNPAYLADAMVCDARSCGVQCAAALKNRWVPVLCGEPFTHSVRDCFLLRNGDLEFRPEEHNNYVFVERLPEVEYGMTVLFDDAPSGGKAKVLTTLCKWYKCETCRPLLCDADIARCEMQDSAGKTPQSGTATQFIDLLKGKAVVGDVAARPNRPFSRRENPMFGPDSDTTGSHSPVPPVKSPDINPKVSSYDHTMLIIRYAGSTVSMEGLIEELSVFTPEEAEARLLSLGMRPQIETSDADMGDGAILGQKDDEVL